MPPNKIKKLQHKPRPSRCFLRDRQNSGRFFETTRYIAANQQIMDNQILCQQITRPIDNISNHKPLKNHCKTTHQNNRAFNRGQTTVYS